MSSRPPRKKGVGDDDGIVSESQSPESLDFDFLDEFCSGVELEELSFTTWCEHHRCLDLQLTLHISLHEAKNGCAKQLEYSRTTRVERNGQIEVSREKHKVSVLVPPNTTDQQTIRIEGLGDCDQNGQGDLQVIIRVS